MSLSRLRPIFCFIHDAGTDASPDRLWDLPEDIWAKVDLIQLRGKSLAAGQLENLARGWLACTRRAGVRIIVNDRLDVALATGADGVHVGADDLPVEVARVYSPEGFVIGASAHGWEGVLAAQESGADYVGLGAFFATETKPGAARLERYEMDRLQNLVTGLTVPVLAIGGLTPERVQSVLRLPVVTGVAASGAIQKAEHPDQVIRRFRRSIDRSWARREGTAMEE